MEIAEANRLVASALRNSKRRILKASSVATRISTSVAVAQRHLDRMCREGLIECVEVGGGELLYRNIVDGQSEGVPPPRAKGIALPRRFSAVDPTDDDEEAIEDFALSFEQQRAAAMWNERMGAQRWHDDPRALAERVRHDGMLPPFYRQMAREI